MRQSSTSLRRAARTTRGATSGAATLAALLTLAACDAPSSLAPDAAPPVVSASVARPAAAAGIAGAPIPGEWIVVLRDDVADAPGLARRLAGEHGGRVLHDFRHVFTGFGASLPDQAVAALRRNPHVRSVTENRVVVADGSGSQTSGLPWGLDRSDQRTRPMDNSYAWANDGAGVTVYIVDTGIRTTHAEYAGRAFPGYTYFADGNGSNDCHGHGTHVAGTVGGSRVGIAKGARLVAVRVLDCNGSGSSLSVAAGLDWVAANAQKPAVVNMSLGGGANNTIDDAVNRVVAAGVSVVVSAGNSGTDACTQSPARAAAAITVGATGSADEQASYSNWGTCVDIYAPGNSVESASFGGDNAYTWMSGTSMASPHVAGAAALVLAASPALTPAQVSATLATNATSGVVTGIGTGSPNRLLFTGFVGGGVTPPPTEPPPPTTPPTPPANAAPVAALTMSCPGNRSACSFDASASSDDKGIVRYEWNFGDGSPVVTTTVPRASRTYTRTGTYTATVTVHDAEGLSARASATRQIRRL